MDFEQGIVTGVNSRREQHGSPIPVRSITFGQDGAETPAICRGFFYHRFSPGATTPARFPSDQAGLYPTMIQ